MGIFFEFLELPQMQRAFWIVVIAAPVAGLLGTFITLRRMSFFSDAIAHGAMTGVTLGFLLHFARDIGDPGMQITLAVFCAGIGLLMAWLIERTTLHADTVIAFSFTGSMALGVVLIKRLRGRQVLENALFGDILAALPSDVWLIGGLAVAVLAFVLLNLRALALCVVNENLARIEGFNTRRLNYCFVVLIAVVVALLLRQLGALLISGLIVIPAAASRLVAGTFRSMLILSAAIGLAGGIIGVWGSYYLDTATGPTIVLGDVAILSACLVIAAVGRRSGWKRGGGFRSPHRLERS